MPLELILDCHIDISPGLAGVRPRVVGHRITIHDIVIRHEHLGFSPDELPADYGLTLADIYAALAYSTTARSKLTLPTKPTKP